MFGRSAVLAPGSGAVCACASAGLFEVTVAAAAAASVPDSKKSRRSMEVPPLRVRSCAWRLEGIVGSNLLGVEAGFPEPHGEERGRKGRASRTMAADSERAVILRDALASLGLLRMRLRVCV